MGKHRSDEPEGFPVGNQDPNKRGLDKTIEQKKEEKRQDERKGGSK